MKNKQSFARVVLLSVVVGLVLISGCTDDPRTDGSSESAIQGSTTVEVDAELYEMLLTVQQQHSTDFPQAKLVLAPVPAREAMRKLMGGVTKGVVVAREYMSDEDSSMKSHQQSFPRTLLAKDALVFYVNKAFPYDTMSSEHIKQWFTGSITDAQMAAAYPKLNGRTPTFVVPSESSVQSNIELVSKGKLVAQRLRGLASKDSILARIRTSENTLIGIGYLSQFAKDSSVKLLRLSFIDSTGTYEFPRVVHAANLIRGLYPFPVPIYFILKDAPSQHSLTSGVMQYMARDANAQRKFFDAGIEPGYAQIDLILPD